MRKLLLLLFMAWMAFPVFAQTTTAPTVPQRAPIRDPFAKPTADQLKKMSAEPVAQPDAEMVEEARAALPAETTVDTAADTSVTTDRTETYAVMEEPASSAGDTAMWVLGGIAALGLIGALAYLILGMGHDERTVYNA